MPKIAFTREFALDALNREQEEDLLTGVINLQDRKMFSDMDDAKLADQLCQQGFIQSKDLMGVYRTIPHDCTDARDLYLVMGWPLMWKEN